MKKRWNVILLGAALCMALSGCGDKDPEDAEILAPTETPVTSEEPQAPDGFVDNSYGLEDYTDEELYLIDDDWILGVRDENVYLNGAGFQSRFAVNMLTTEGSGGIGLMDIHDKIDYVRLGDKEYSIDDLVRPRTEGFQVLSMLAEDFGIDQYSADESGLVSLSGCLGTELSGEELREAYSERDDLEDYTVCVYYLHARMSGMDESENDACRDMLQDEYGIDHSSSLDGVLAVMLYYDVNGYDMFYTLAIAAPNYWNDSDDFEANMLNPNRHDISKCHMSISGIPIGFVNQVFLRCDTDTTVRPGMPEGAVNDGAEDGDGAVEDLDTAEDGLTVEGDETE